MHHDKNALSHNDSEIQLENIILLDQENIDSMPINVAGDSYRDNQVIINGKKV